MANRGSVVASAMSEATQCTHYWILGHPKAGVVHGTCKYCEAEADFPASGIGKPNITPGRGEMAVQRKKLRRSDFEDRRAEIIADWRALGWKGVQRKWGVVPGTFRRWLIAWGVDPPILMKRVDKPPETPVQWLMRMFPSFSSNWDAEVQIEWFVTFRELITAITKEGQT